MKIAVVGLWHLGTVTAACLAEAGHHVIAYDPDKTRITHLKNAQSPIFEPHLDDLLKKGLQAGKLHFSSQLTDLNTVEVVWITFDTPVDSQDHADIDFVYEQVKALFPYLNQTKLVLISSQLLVGSTRRLEEMYAAFNPHKKIDFAYSPENLRLGKAIEVFMCPERIVVGIRAQTDKPIIEKLLKSFSQNIIWMSVESAEMTKHALNAFLATSVVFINELATLCERVGADATEVEKGLKSETRIGPRAYLRPGAAFAGGTLARDVSYLIKIGKQQHLPTQLFSAVIASNASHKIWSQRKLAEIFGQLRGKTIAVLGLAYKPGTDTLRRSATIETCEWLRQQGSTVIAYDPAIKQLPSDLAKCIELKSSWQNALQDADAALISTECPEFTTLTASDFIAYLRQPTIVLDPGAFLAKNLIVHDQIRYFSVGKQL